MRTDEQWWDVEGPPELFQHTMTLHVPDLQQTPTHCHHALQASINLHQINLITPAIKGHHHSNLSSLQLKLKVHTEEG